MGPLTSDLDFYLELWYFQFLFNRYLLAEFILVPVSSLNS